ncbi:MAG: DUF2442 domain-containing protein [Cytophagales bacterium]
MEGIIGIKPLIKKITWLKPNFISIYLEDGRTIETPVRYFPSLKKTKVADRAKPQIINGNMFTFLSCTEVFHIEQILGKEKDYNYSNIRDDR